MVASEQQAFTFRGFERTMLKLHFYAVFNQAGQSFKPLIRLLKLSSIALIAFW